MAKNYHELIKLFNVKYLNPKKSGVIIFDEGRRKLGWAQFGKVDPIKETKTVLYFHGTPMCRFEPRIHSSLSQTVQADLNFDDIYEQRNIRLICLERPGFGMSTHLSHRSVADWVKDVEAVIDSDQLGIKDSMFYVMGFSAGGPYALALRNMIPHRILAAAVVASSANISMIDSPSYSLKLRGLVEALFFSLPQVIQAAVFGISVRAVLAGFRVSKLSLQVLIQLLRLVIPDHTKSAGDDKGASVFNANIVAGYVQPALNITMALACAEERLGVLESVIAEATRQGFSPIVVDTLACQSLPWGFDLNARSYIARDSPIPRAPTPDPTLSAMTHSSHVSSASSLSADQSTCKGEGEGNSARVDSPLPPVLLFFSREDWTVPASTAEWLAQQLYGAAREHRPAPAPVSASASRGVDIDVDGGNASAQTHINAATVTWISGGHHCFFVHLDRILDDLLAAGVNHGGNETC